MATQTRVGERLSFVVREPSSKKSRSHEVIAYVEKFEAFKKAFKPLQLALKNHYANLKAMETSETEVMKGLTQFIQKSPLAVPGNNPFTVEQDLLKKQTAYSERYLNEIVEYVREWELIVTTRVDASEKQMKDYNQDLQHYEKKVAKLLHDHETAVAKGKTPDEKQDDRLKRNEEKLSMAKDGYEKHATELCNLLEGVIDCAWKDVVPLMLRLMKLNRDTLEGKTEIMKATNVIDKMKAIAEEHNINVTKPPPPTPKSPSKKENKNVKKVAPESKKVDKVAPEKEDTADQQEV